MGLAECDSAGPRSSLNRVEKVFISSVMRGFEAERLAAKRAIESLGLRALRAEDAPASPDPSKEALLPLVEQADAVVLILGRRYGWVSDVSGLSPTEEEFNHARAASKPVLVFVQKEVEFEPAQEAFKSRVGGTWEAGAFTGFFSDPQDLALQIVKALNSHAREQTDAGAAPAAQQTAAELASGESRRRLGSNSFRVALVPVGSAILVDALVLEDQTLEARASELVRKHGLIPQSAGIDARTDSSGLRIVATSQVEWHTPLVVLGADGSVLSDTGAQAEGTMGGMALSFPKIERAIRATTALAQELWALLPEAHRIRQVAAAVGVPDANHHPLVMSGQVGGGSMGIPTVSEPLVAPSPAVVVRRADVGSDEMVRRLAIHLKRAFADHGAVIE